MEGARGWGGEGGLFPGDGGSVWKMGSPGDDGGNADITRVYLTPLSCALKNGYGGKFYIIYIFLQF